MPLDDNLVATTSPVSSIDTATAAAEKRFRDFNHPFKTYTDAGRSPPAAPSVTAIKLPRLPSMAAATEKKRQKTQKIC